MIEVVRRNGEWLAFYSGNEGVKRKVDDIHIPASLNESELEEYLADVFHEWATPDYNEVRKL